MKCYKAEALSRQYIRDYVYVLKKKVGLENTLYFPILIFVENVLPLLVPDFQFEVVSKNEMGCKHGETYPCKSLIRIREDVYLGAAQGNGRDRLTIAHEVRHLLLHFENAIALCKLAPNEQLKPYEDPEWQADAFGGELLASSYLIAEMSPSEVVHKCGVSISAAKTQLKACRKPGGDVK